MSKKLERASRLNKRRVQDYRQKHKIKKQSNSDTEVEYNNLDEPHFFPETFDDLLQDHIENDHEISDFSASERTIWFSSDESEYSDSDNESDTDDVNADTCSESFLMHELRKWALKCKLPHIHLQSLLKVLKPFHPELPLSSKTLLKTNLGLRTLIKKFNPDNVTDTAEFIYFGIAWNLERIVNVELHTDDVLKLQFNADGLPLFKSSSLEFWPLLGKIYNEANLQYKPFTIAVHCGHGKPKSVEKYLSHFIEELNHLLQNGIIMIGKQFKIEVMCFICDRPARAFLKCIKSHNAYYACERCNVKGIYYKNRVIYPSVNSDKRTDQSFRVTENAEHHNSISPLINVEPAINMVNDFILDFMHLAFLGVTKKLLCEYWLGSCDMKLSRDNVLRLSQRLMNLSNQVPCEFQRTTRSLTDINKWKATEFRFFLLYSGAFVLKGLLSESAYKHFLLLNTSCRILSSEQLCIEHLDSAQFYLTRFVLLCQQIYGMESQILNVHSLIHIAEDVRHMQCSLSNLTAFPFENSLGQLKKCLRSGNKPLIQLCKRMEEEMLIGNEQILDVSKIQIISSCKKGDQLKIKRLKYYDCEVTTKKPNNVVLLKNNLLVQIEDMILPVSTTKASEICVIGKKLNIIKSAVDYPPGASTLLNMFIVEEPEVLESVQFNPNDIKCKIVLLKIFELNNDPQEVYAIPLLHNV